MGDGIAILHTPIMPYGNERAVFHHGGADGQTALVVGFKRLFVGRSQESQVGV